MAHSDQELDLARQLHALVTHLHATANRDLLEQIKREGLTFERIQLLERLRGGKIRPTVQQCAQIMWVHKGSASRMIDELAVRGLLRRVTDDNDSRAKRIEITPAGEDVLIRLHAARIPAITAFADHLTPVQHQQLQDAITAILHPQPEIHHEPPATPAAA